MGFLSGTQKVASVIGKGAWKTGTLVWKFGGRPAAKGMVWVVKKAAVDPAANKIKEWSLVKNATAVKERLARGNCAQCGKKKSNPKRDFCSTGCANQAFESWSRVEQKRTNIHAPNHDIDGIYHSCGCNRHNLYHNCPGKEGERI